MACDGYIICTTPRSGSTLLCRMLAATGRMGHPNSYFREEDVSEWAEEWQVSTDRLPFSKRPSGAYLNAAIKVGQSETPVFGLRLMYESLDGLLDYLRVTVARDGTAKDHLKAAFGSLVFVHLERKDTVAQAISLLKAQQSGLWHRAQDGTDIERLPTRYKQGYDFDRLHTHVSGLNHQKTGWQKWFAQEGIAPISITYDDLSNRANDVIADICSACGVYLTGDYISRPDTAILRDKTNAEWARRYAEDLVRFGKT